VAWTRCAPNRRCQKIPVNFGVPFVYFLVTEATGIIIFCDSKLTY
jgi:hypothetical protein